MRLRAWAVAWVLMVPLGCGPSNGVETPKDPVQKLNAPPTSGPPADAKKR